MDSKHVDNFQLLFQCVPVTLVFPIQNKNDKDRRHAERITEDGVHVCRRSGCQKILKIIPVRTDWRDRQFVERPRGQLQSTLLKTHKKSKQTSVLLLLFTFHECHFDAIGTHCVPAYVEAEHEVWVPELGAHAPDARQFLHGRGVVVSIHVHVQLGGLSPPRRTPVKTYELA